MKKITLYGNKLPNIKVGANGSFMGYNSKPIQVRMIFEILKIFSI